MNTSVPIASSTAGPAGPARVSTGPATRGVTALPASGWQVRLAARPAGLPTPDDFTLEQAAVPAPRAGQAVVRTTYFALDAATRLFLDDNTGLPLPRLGIGDVVIGEALGEVIASADPAFAVGDVVRHQKGWQEYVVADTAALRRVDPAAFPTPTAHLAPLLTAWAGLVAVAELRTGDVVFVSGAAGAVGGLAGQIARLRGAGRVIGSAGSAGKVAHLTGALGFDAAFDYRDGPVLDQLREHAPGGIDVCFDNTGGAQLATALRLMRPHGRVALCGLLERLNRPRRMPDQVLAGGETVPIHRPQDTATDPAQSTERETEPDLGFAIANRLTLRGFRTSDFLDRQAEAEAEVGSWLATGQLRLDESIVDGIENAPRAFSDLMRGAFTGRVLVRPDR
ncbi:MDR family NADP-dependent oxidoreductase [Protofrankia symbiont of Coriaria ruscifolia]|uniref:MDR family NADP-dependent oxidoreductase n=1 Tax=Protofrankia symbiont of Coriaria ruscifolia TaxID=1306542 RepID=UPI0010412CA6|nr:NADP-dependent oxidoreductase [Protofrankia symbiont of Coriaria ruscifolia]